jgi:hypothetical protein
MHVQTRLGLTVNYALGIQVGAIAPSEVDKFTGRVDVRGRARQVGCWRARACLCVGRPSAALSREAGALLALAGNRPLRRWRSASTDALGRGIVELAGVGSVGRDGSFEGVAEGGGDAKREWEKHARLVVERDRFGGTRLEHNVAFRGSALVSREVSSLSHNLTPPISSYVPCRSSFGG